MNHQEYVMYGLVLLAGFALYKAVTLQLSVTARGHMTHLIRHIEENDAYSNDLKIAAMAFFQLSVKSSALPMLLICSIVCRSKGRGRVVGDERKILKDVGLQFIKVNSLAAPHWYLIAMMVFFVTVVVVGLITFGSRTGYNLISSLEHAISNPYLKTT